MKKALMMMGLGASFLWGSQDMTIQVINAVYEKSITKEFEAKLKESGIAANKKVENGHYIVTLGTYKDEESARKDLEKVRSVVVKDAFIRPVDRSASAMAQNVKPKTKTVTAHADKKVKTAEKTKVAAKTHAAEPAAAPEKSTKTETVAAVASPAVHETKAVVQEPEKKAEVKAVVAAEPVILKQPATEGPSCPITPTPTEVKTIPILASVVMVERNELRRREIHDAIEYYKNSPYHRFEPVKMQP